jgi:hypothetical protein
MSTDKSEQKHERLTVYTPGAAVKICRSMIKNRKVILFGTDGAGRTTLMVQVRDLLMKERIINAGDYRVLNYVDSLEETIKANAPPEINEDQAANILRDIFSRRGKILFIDNIDGTVSEDASLDSLLNFENVLVTATSADVLGEYGGDFVKYEIAIPSEKECRELFDNLDKKIAYNPFEHFSQIAGNDADDVGYRKYVFDTLYQKTGGHPMALRLLDELGKAMGYYKILEQVRELDINPQDAITAKNSDNKCESLKNLFKKLIGLYLDSDSCDKNQRWLLRLFALMPYRMLREADILLFTDNKYAPALSKLAERSLIQSHKSVGGAMYYAIHPIIAHAVHSIGVDIEPYRELVYRLQETLSEFPGSGLCHYAWMAQLVESAAKYYYGVEGQIYDDSLRAALFTSIGAVLRKRGGADAKQYDNAEVWLKRAYKIQRRLFSDSLTDRVRFDFAVTLCNLGEIYRDYHKDYELARKFQETALNLKREIRDPYFPKIRLHIAKSGSMLAKTLLKVYGKSRERTDLETALELQRESENILLWRSEPEARVDLAEICSESARISRKIGDVKAAISRQLTARDLTMRAMESAEMVESENHDRNMKPRIAGFFLSALECQLVNVCEELAEFYDEADEYDKACFYREYVNRKRSERERMYIGG